MSREAVTTFILVFNLTTLVLMVGGVVAFGWAAITTGWIMAVLAVNIVAFLLGIITSAQD